MRKAPLAGFYLIRCWIVRDIGRNKLGESIVHISIIATVIKSNGYYRKTKGDRTRNNRGGTKTKARQNNLSGFSDLDNLLVTQTHQMWNTLYPSLHRLNQRLIEQGIGDYILRAGKPIGH